MSSRRPDFYSGYLESLRSETELLIARSRAGRAAADFEQWWLANEPLALGTPEPAFFAEQVNKELEHASAEIKALREELTLLRGQAPGALEAQRELAASRDRLEEERARLSARLAEALEAGREAERLSAENRARAAASLAESEKRAAGSEDAARREREKTQALEAELAALAAERSRLAARAAELEEGLRRSELERAGLEREAARLSAELERKSREASTLAGALEELRRLARAPEGGPAAEASAERRREDGERLREIIELLARAEDPED